MNPDRDPFDNESPDFDEITRDLIRQANRITLVGVVVLFFIFQFI